MGRLTEIWQAAIGKKEPNPLDRYVYQMIGGSAIYPEIKNEFYLNSYTGNNDVFCVINKITEPASAVPIFQYDAKGELVENGRMLARLNNPNGYQSRTQFIEAGLSFYGLFGECFTAYETVELGPNKGIPARLDQLPPQWVQLNIGTYFDPVSSYSFYPLSQMGKPDYPKEQVFHWKDFNPEYTLTGGHLRGMSRLKPLIKTITGSSEGYNSLVKAFQNQGMWGLLSLLDPDGKQFSMTKEQKSLLKSNFRKDAAKGDMTILNSKGEYIKMGLTIVELDVIKALSVLSGKIYDVYGLPDQLFSGSQTKTYANQKEAERAAWENARKPWLDAYLEGFSKWLAPHFPGEEDHVLRADYSGIDALQANMVEKVQWMVQAQSFSRNDIREACGWERLDVPGMDDILVSAGVVPISEVGLMDIQTTEDALKALKISDYRAK